MRKSSNVTTQKWGEKKQDELINYDTIELNESPILQRILLRNSTF